MSVKYLLLGIVIVMVVAGYTLETETSEKHLARSTRSIISTIVDGLKNIHDNFHKKPDTPKKIQLKTVTQLLKLSLLRAEVAGLSMLRLRLSTAVR